MKQRATLDFANLDSTGNGAYRVKSNRQPRYFGANIIPLTARGDMTVRVTSAARFSASLAIRSGSSTVRYVALRDGSGQASIDASQSEEVSLIVVNTPDTLYEYDPFMIGGDVAVGLDYQVQLTDAVPTD